MKLSVLVLLACTFCSLTLVGCLDLLADDEFIKVLPKSSDLQIIMGKGEPLSEDDGLSTQDILNSCPGICEKNGELSHGLIYELTNEAATKVNNGLTDAYFWLDFVTRNIPFTTKIENGYIWGPWNEINLGVISQMNFRFVMIKTGDSKFEYQIEGMQLIEEEEQWVPFVDGEVESTDTPHKGKGNILINFDTLRQLDSALTVENTGQILYEFDIRQTSPTPEEPNTVNVIFSDFYGEENSAEVGDKIDARYYYERHENSAGLLRFTTRADIIRISNEENRSSEVLEVETRWNEHGVGKSTAQVTSESLTEFGMSSYTMTQCWEGVACNYYETFNHISIEYENETAENETLCGEISKCPDF
jgi:hypothetical protein